MREGIVDVEKEGKDLLVVEQTKPSTPKGEGKLRGKGKNWGQGLSWANWIGPLLLLWTVSWLLG